LAFDAAVVLSAQNLDVAVVSPVSVPRVGNQPVRSRIFHSPAQDTDSMTAQSLAVNVLVHTCPSTDNQSVIKLDPINKGAALFVCTCFVGREIFIDSQCTLHWTVVHNLELNVLNVFVDRIRRCACTPQPKIIVRSLVQLLLKETKSDYQSGDLVGKG